VLGLWLNEAAYGVRSHPHCWCAALTPEQIKVFLEAKTVELAGTTLAEEDIRIVRQVVASNGGLMEANGNGDILIVLDCTNESALVEEGLARELINRIQKMRKKVRYDGDSDGGARIVSSAIARRRRLTVPHRPSST